MRCFIGALAFLAALCAAPALAQIGTTGDVEPSDTPPASWTSSTSVYVGNTADGTLSDGGAAVASGAACLGYGPGVAGIATISGPGSTWAISGGLEVGGSGSGTLNIMNGGAMNAVATCYIGLGAGSTGIANISGAGSTWTAGGVVFVGDDGNGILAVTNGGAFSGSIAMASNASLTSTPTGTIVVDGPGSTLSTTGVSAAWHGGSTALLQITNGGRLVNSGDYQMATGSGAVAMASVDGAGSTWTNNGTIEDGDAAGGIGAISVSGGGALASTGTVTVNATSALEIDVGRSSSISVAGGSGKLINNGTVRVVAGANPKTAGNTYTPISASGAIGGTVQAVGGTWNSSQNAMTVSSVVSGTAGAAVTMSLSQNQRMLISDGDGHSLGASFLSSWSLVSLTASTVSGAALTSLQGDLSGGQAILSGWALSNATDPYSGPAYLSLSTGPIYANLGFAVWSYDSAAGAWSQIAPPDLTLDATNFYASFCATAGLDRSAYAVTGFSALPGDANLDGAVDINDLTIVLSHFGQSGMTWTQGVFDGDAAGKVDVNDLTIVLSEFGKVYGSSLAAPASVPEPGIWALLAAGFFAVSIGRRALRRRHAA
jgi:T5SS/PEP-CTERM-associated repeat protein